MENIVNDQAKLIEFLKEMIIDTLKLEDVSAEAIDDDAPLFKEGLGLDSIDALELVVAIEKVFNVIIEDEDVGKEAFGSIRILAGFIQREFTGTGKNTISAAG
ncbi:phosphopantetheine-binding protein [Thermodesulfobacteriota bacterium]